jgi:small-conductance mechanosensitive channel
MRKKFLRMASPVLAAVLAAILNLALIPAALAQVPDNVQTLIEEAEQNGMTVIVIAPESEEAAPAVEPTQNADGLHSAVTLISTEIREIAGSWGTLRAEARSAMASHGDGSRSWIFPTLLLGLVPLAVGSAAAWLLGRWLRARFSAAAPLAPRDRADRLLRLLGLAVLRIVLLAVLLAVALLVAVIIREGSPSWHVTMSSYLLAAAIIGGAWIMFSVFLAPNDPHLRVLALTDAEARRLQRDVMIAVVISVVALGIVRWMLLLGVPRDVLKPIVIISMFVTALVMSIVAILHRQPIGRLIAGAPGSGVVPAWRLFLARFWPVIAIAYFLLSWVVGAGRLLLDRPGSLGLVATPILILLGGFALYGLLLLVVDLLAARRAQRRLRLAASAAGASGTTPPPVAVTAAAPEPSPSAEPSVLKRLLERAAAVISFAVGLYFLTTLWGLDEAAGETVSEAIIQVIVVLLLAYLGYQAARLWIDRKIADDLRMSTAGEHGAAPSRLGTLLPIFRNFLLVSIGVIASLIVLSRMGVDIGPLLAGAGVIGLAIGFGAQTLVKDIISGAFFLVDDAFRVGEYIDLGGSKGVVEKISIRSMQLRHQNGPLNTVPFGSIGEVSNFSRDWAVMKLPLRVTYDTDVEKVRKLIKKLGEELMHDPDIGKYFLQPLKSQGITAMEDSAMIIRVKFMTHPMNQSEVRKAVYMRIQSLFQREGIKFAQKEVRVRIADEGGEDDPARRAAAAKAAAQAVIDDEDALAAMQPAKA